MRRVVVTGIGAVSPLGNDVATTWDGLVAGKSGIDFIQGFDASDYPVRIGAEVKDFDPAGLAPPKELRKLARYTQFSLAAAKEAVEDADLLGAYKPERVGIVLGSAVGDIGTIAEQERTLLERGPSRVAPWFIPSMLTDAASGQLAIAFGFSGPNFAGVAACATGSYTIGEARRDRSPRRGRRHSRRRRRGRADAADPGRLLQHARARRREGVSAARLAPVRRDPRRLRDRRGRRHPRARGAGGARARAARRSTPRSLLRRLERRLSTSPSPTRRRPESRA